MSSRNCLIIHAIIFIMVERQVKGFGINIMVVPEDDPSQVICTVALLSKYFRSGEPLSGSVLSMSLTSASINVQQSLLRAIHTDRTYPWTVVINDARKEKPSTSATPKLHEKPQCYFVIVENLENDDLDDIFEDWKSTINWNPMAQFVVYLASVEETDDEMTELMIEILLNFLNKKIYNINVIGQNDENGFFYGKTVFPYHPDNNCGNRVIAIETLDLCDYQEAEQEHNDDEEEEYAYDEENNGDGNEGNNVIKEERENKVEEEHRLNEKGDKEQIYSENDEVGERFLGVKGEKEIAEGEEETGNENGDVAEEELEKGEEMADVVEQEKWEEKVGDEYVKEIWETEEVETTIGEEKIREKNIGEKKVDGAIREAERGLIMQDDNFDKENIEEKERKEDATPQDWFAEYRETISVEENIDEAQIMKDFDAEEEETIEEDELDEDEIEDKEKDKVVVSIEENGLREEMENEFRSKEVPEETVLKEKVNDEYLDDEITGNKNEEYLGNDFFENIEPDEGRKVKKETGQGEKEEEKRENKDINNEDSVKREEGDQNLINQTLVDMNMEEQVMPTKNIKADYKAEEKELVEKKKVLKREREEKVFVGENTKSKNIDGKEKVQTFAVAEYDANMGINTETYSKEVYMETGYWNKNYTAMEYEKVQKNFNKPSTSKNFDKDHADKNSIGKKNANSNHSRMKKLRDKTIIASKRFRNISKSPFTKKYAQNTRKTARRKRQVENDIDNEETDTGHDSKNDDVASQGTIYMEEQLRALFLDKFPRDLSGCTLVAAFRSWEPYIFSLEKAKEKKNDGDTTAAGSSNGDDTGDEFENEPAGDMFGEAGDVASGVDVFGDTAIFGNSEFDGNGEGDEDSPRAGESYGNGAGNSEDFEPDTSQIEGELKLSGIEYKMVQTIAERLHINIDIQVENNNLYQLFQQLIDGDIEMVVGGIDEDPSISQFVSSTIPYYQDDLTWCVAKAKRQHNLFNFLATFRIDTWLLTQACVLLLSLTVFFTQRALKIQLAQLQGYFNIVLRLFGVIITTQSMHLKCIPSALKITLGSAFFMSLMFSNIYQSFLISTLTNPNSMFQISHITEIYHHRMAIMGSVENVRHMNKDGEIFEYIRERFQMCYNIEECLIHAATDNRVAVAVSRLHTYYNPRIPRDLLYCFDRDENLYAYLVTMLLPKKFHLLHMINPVIQHVIESGHMQKWSRDLDNKRQIEQETHKVREAAVSSLNLAEVGGSFAFMGFMLLFALIVLVVEFWVHRMVTQQRSRLILVKILHKHFS